MTNSYGTEFHDFDDDGDLDLFMVGADGEPSKLFRNSGSGMFTDVDTLTGHPLLSTTAGDLNGGRPIDYDNDGDLDLFFHDHKPFAGQNQARKLFRNDGNWNFTDVTVAEGLAATNEGAYDSVWGDIDLDGDMDLIAPTDNGFAERVFLNDAAQNGNHWLYVTLAGPDDNTTGLGATIYATLNEGTPLERTLRREANTNAGTFNQSDLPVHFGLGDVENIDRLRIEWPDGTVQLFEDVAADQRLLIAIRTACDFDSSGSCDLADLNSLLAAGPVATGTPAMAGVNEQFDLNGDGWIDNQDVDAWLAGAATENGFAHPYFRGDANLDGSVDVSDFNSWNSGKFSSSLRWDHGDFNGDGMADVSDFNLWNGNKFMSSVGPLSVPEPNGLGLAFGLLFAAPKWLGRRSGTRTGR